MKDEIISFETAKLAKEREFKAAECHGVRYTVATGELKHFGSGGDNAGGEYMNGTDFILAPTQSLLQRWLREVHDIHMKIIIAFRYGNTPRIYFYKLEDFDGEFGKDCKSYEEALEEGLLEALKLIK